MTPLPNYLVLMLIPQRPNLTDLRQTHLRRNVPHPRSGTDIGSRDCHSTKWTWLILPSVRGTHSLATMYLASSLLLEQQQVVYQDLQTAQDVPQCRSWSQLGRLHVAPEARRGRQQPQLLRLRCPRSWDVLSRKLLPALSSQNSQFHR